ncbi:MAG TPA: molybdenum cofactor biosynthesis protein B [Gemmatimonadaceae bacterium]|nr:molybdenum cofactor biosynthesis protein B [Gemmatimonadaceae bacterium]
MTLPEGTREHRRQASALESIRCAVITVSDTRTEATDESGKLIQQLLTGAGHTIVRYVLLPNVEALVTSHVAELLGDDADAVILTGGTGLGEKDRTVEAVQPLLDKELPGFGELFRFLSYQEQIGSAAILSRAVAGGARRTLVVALPGSRAAVELALTKILLPELKHLVWELRK